VVVVPPPIARDRTAAGSLARALAESGSIGAFRLRSLTAACTLSTCCVNSAVIARKLSFCIFSDASVARRVLTSARALQRAPRPTSTGRLKSRAITASVGRRLSVNLRTTPVVRSAMTTV
jgi:hypothetical protein